MGSAAVLDLDTKGTKRTKDTMAHPSTRNMLWVRWWSFVRFVAYVPFVSNTAAILARYSALSR
jgi:hypothetical protein